MKIAALGEISKSGLLLWTSTGAPDRELIKTSHIGKNIFQFILKILIQEQVAKKEKE